MSTPAIELDGVGRTYPGPPPVTALTGATVRIDEGEFVAVVGPSGSGKSTFLNMLGLLDTPTAGTYRLGGVDTSLLGEDARTGLRGARIGFVFQSFHLMNHRSAVENVELAMLYQRVDPRDRTSRARRALEQVRLGHRADALPSQLSGGERQRVAIARALVQDAPVLLLDEATSALDAQSEAIVAEALALGSQGRTTLVIAHRLATVRGADKIVVMDHGRVAETGTHDQLLAQGGLYAGLYRLQFKD